MKVQTKQFKVWITALRSGQFKQGENYLQNENGYCCLGVACLVTIPKRKLETDDMQFIIGAIPEDQQHAPKWLKDINEDFYEKTGHPLTIINDSGKYSFDDIADILELVYIHKALD